MQVYRNEALLQSLDNIEVSPIGLVKNVSASVVNFHHDLIDVLEVVPGEGSQARPLRAFDVHLQDYVPVC